MNHQLQPLGDRCIIEPAAAPEKVGSIFVPSMSKEKPTRGTVIAVGTGRMSDQGFRVPMTVQEGDEVIFNFYNTSEVEVDGKKYCMIHENEIACIVKKNSTA
jgi:chaperonin GroES